MSEHPLADPDIEVTVQDLAQRREAGEDVQVIDVREPYEWEAGRIPGTRHLELERLSSQAATIDKDKPVVFHCRAGVRSLMAARAFRSAGYAAYSLRGGIEAWHNQGHALEPADGSVADH
jgi:rhodanese-related sulfurtransferase